jgi:feruloyl-CoA synthase
MDLSVERRGDGTMVVRSPHPLGPYPRCLTDRLVHWAGVAPERRFIAQRDELGAWRALTYAQTLARVRAIAQTLLDRKLSAERPLAILSDNDIEHALLALAAMHVGVPYVPVSSAYSLVSSDHAKLRHVMSLVTPGLVFASDEKKFARAVEAAIPSATEVIFKLDAGAPSAAVDEAHARVGPDTIAKLLLTSGSTGQPKAVVNTQRMLCANQQMLVQALPSLREPAPILVDWLPWNHTAGGNHNFGLVLYNGGTLYIDDGKPVPGLIERTLRNLREVAPTVYFNVPRGYEVLLPYLREDATLRNHFFSRLGLLHYAAAVLPQPTWKAYEELAIKSRGEPVRWVTGYGSTEMAPLVMCTRDGAARAGTVGLPVDGVEMKLVPEGDKLEARFRGPSITPGYWREHDLTRAAFDEEGFYRTGDAMRLADAADPRLGFEFDGRTAEDFKLTTARINSTGSPYIQDAVITGHNRGEIGALIFPNAEACRALDSTARRHVFQDVLNRLAKGSTGSSTRIARALVLDEPPSLDAGEITDKGSINQRAVLRARAVLVEELYAEPPRLEGIIYA